MSLARIITYLRFSGVLVLLVAGFLTSCTNKKEVVDKNEYIYKNGVSMMNDKISITVSGSQKPSFLHGPVKAIVVVNNISANPVQILLPYPNPNYLSFECKSEEFARQKVVEQKDIERSAPITINPGESYTAIYYLNRYFVFQKQGETTVSYRLETLVTTEPGTEKVVHEDAVFEGEFAVKLIQGTERDLQQELAMYAGKLNTSNQQVKMESAEALAFLDIPLSVDYVARMLSIDNLEIIGIRALARQPSIRTHDLIVGMLSHRDSMVVVAVLEEIDHCRIPVPRQEIHNLLVSDNPNVRWVALDWLARHPDLLDLQFLTPLLKDENTSIQTLANKYTEFLKRK